MVKSHQHFALFIFCTRKMYQSDFCFDKRSQLKEEKKWRFWSIVIIGKMAKSYDWTRLKQEAKSLHYKSSWEISSSNSHHYLSTTIKWNFCFQGKPLLGRSYLILLGQKVVAMNNPLASSHSLSFLTEKGDIKMSQLLILLLSFLVIMMEYWIGFWSYATLRQDVNVYFKSCNIVNLLFRYFSGNTNL